MLHSLWLICSVSLIIFVLLTLPKQESGGVQTITSSANISLTKPSKSLFISVFPWVLVILYFILSVIIVFA